MTTYGYARVSTREQNLDRQFDALAAAGVARRNIFADKASGKNFDRPEYTRLLARLCEGDVLVVKSIDRLGRNYEEILEQWRNLTKRRACAVVVLDMPLLDTRVGQGDLTNVLIGDIVLQLLSYVAQVERENIRQRQAEGIRSAHARGVRFGRPKKPRPKGCERIMRECREGRITKTAAAAQLNISRGTLYKWMQEEDGAAPCELA